MNQSNVQELITNDELLLILQNNKDIIVEKELLECILKNFDVFINSSNINKLNDLILFLAKNSSLKQINSDNFIIIFQKAIDTLIENTKIFEVLNLYEILIHKYTFIYFEGFEKLFSLCFKGNQLKINYIEKCYNLLINLDEKILTEKFIMTQIDSLCNINYFEYATNLLKNYIEKLFFI